MLLRFFKFFIIYLSLSVSFSSCYIVKNLGHEKCPIESCKVRSEHYHEEFVFRSRVTPWWKKNQNPKIGQDWKAKKDNGKDKVRRD